MKRWGEDKTKAWCSIKVEIVYSNEPINADDDDNSVLANQELENNQERGIRMVPDYDYELNANNENVSFILLQRLNLQIREYFDVCVKCSISC